MKSILALIPGIVTAVALLGAPAHADMTDFALFDATNPANQIPGGLCRIRGTAGNDWNFNVAVSNNDPTNAQSFQLIYKDGDFVRYFVAPHSSFALTQSAGNNPAGSAIRVFAPQNSQLSGAVSAEGLDRTVVECISCDTGANPGKCLNIIPNP